MKNQKKWIGLVLVLSLLLSVIPSGRALAASYKSTKFKSYMAAINSHKKQYGANSACYANVKIKTKYGEKKTVFTYGVGCTSSATTVYNYLKYKKKIYKTQEINGFPVAISKDREYIYVDLEFTTDIMGFLLQYSPSTGKYEEKETFTYSGAGEGYEAEKEFRKKYGLEKNNIVYKSTYKTYKAQLSADIYKEGNWVYYHDQLGDYRKRIKAGYYKYNTKTKKKKFIYEHEIIGDFIIHGKYIYIHGFKYDDDQSWVCRIDKNGKGKKKLFTTTKAGASNFYLYNNKLFLPTNNNYEYITYDLRTGKKKTVSNPDFGLSVKKSSPRDGYKGSVSTGKLNYKISSDYKKLTRGKKAVYKCNSKEKIRQVSVHKNAVVLYVYYGGGSSQEKIVYVDKNGKHKKVLRGAAPCYG